jgi:hypothetical protein
MAGMAVMTNAAVVLVLLVRLVLVNLVLGGVVLVLLRMVGGPGLVAAVVESEGSGESLGPLGTLP